MSETILDKLAAHAVERTEAAKRIISAADIKHMALDIEKGSHSFEKALSKEGLSFILECKKASPSKGLIAPDFPYVKIAKEYEEAGADCISVLTEPKWFLGKNEYLKEITETVSIPCIRKDFTVDEYMIYEARTLGASAILLICSILSKGQIEEYLGICGELGIDAIVIWERVNEETALRITYHCGFDEDMVSEGSIIRYSDEQWGEFIKLKKPKWQ